MNTLDCRQLPCPQPVMRCRELLDTHKPAALQVVVDNEAAAENVERFLVQRRYTVQCHKEGSCFTLSAALADTGAAPEVAEQASPKDGQEKILVFITTETMGRGDEDLGRKLMATFLATLPEMGANLWRIVLLNGGVKLAATEGQALQSLQKLEENGVSVLVCGTCLAHYGLTEHKAAGQTSNMLDIVTSLELADKIIRP